MYGLVNECVRCILFAFGARVKKKTAALVFHPLGKLHNLLFCFLSLWLGGIKVHTLDIAPLHSFIHTGIDLRGI